MQISKPVYVSDGSMALVAINKGTQIYIAAFEKEQGKWEELGIMAPLFVQLKAQKFTYPN